MLDTNVEEEKTSYKIVILQPKCQQLTRLPFTWGMSFILILKVYSQPPHTYSVKYMLPNKKGQTYIRNKCQRTSKKKNPKWQNGYGDNPKQANLSYLCIVPLHLIKVKYLILRTKRSRGPDVWVNEMDKHDQIKETDLGKVPPLPSLFLSPPLTTQPLINHISKGGEPGEAHSSGFPRKSTRRIPD